MLPPIPYPEDYGVSEEYGFLSDELPIEILPDPYYKEWEAVVANLQALLLSRRLKRRIDTLPIVTALRLRTPAEWRRAYMLLSFMTHAYIWGGDKPEEVGLSSVCRIFWLTVSHRGSHRRFPFLTNKFANTSNYLQWLHTPAYVFGISSPSSRMSQLTI